MNSPVNTAHRYPTRLPRRIIVISPAEISTTPAMPKREIESFNSITPPMVTSSGAVPRATG